MRSASLAGTLAVLAVLASPACAVTLTFDDVPATFNGLPPELILGAYYSSLYGIGFGRGFYAADHTGSTWGPPRSGSKVLAWSFAGVSNWYGIGLKSPGGSPLFAYSVGGYFSTEPGVVLRMIGYHLSLDDPVGYVTIGAPGESWNNVYREISSAVGHIGMVEFRPVTADALAHFSADDIGVQFVPEPASLLGLLAGVGALAIRRRR